MLTKYIILKRVQRLLAGQRMLVLPHFNTFFLLIIYQVYFIMLHIYIYTYIVR